MSVREKAKKHKVYAEMYFEGRFVVKSGTSGELYEVDEHAGHYYCNCAWGNCHVSGAPVCSHVIAVQNAVNRRRIVESLNEPEVLELSKDSKTYSVLVGADGSIVVTHYR